MILIILKKIDMSTIENIFRHFQPIMLQFLKYSDMTEIIKLSNMINVPVNKYSDETYKNMIASVC